MANEHYEEALKGLPCRVSSLASLIHQVICYRYDTRETVKGKPNPGYRKSYPGMPQLVKATGKSRQACNTAVEELISNKIIDRVTIGRPGYQAEYRPVYVLGQLGEHVNLSLHVSKPYKSKKVAEHVSLSEATSQEGLHNVSSKLDTISTISNHKYDKYNHDFKVNTQRWHLIAQALPTLLVSQWVHTKESEMCLDVILQGTTLNAFKAELRTHNFALAGDQTAVLMSLLRTRSGFKKPSVSKLESDLYKINSYDLDAELKKYSSFDLGNFGKLPE
jgi:hypothetical protein